jgi:hypothetical protein
MTNAENYAAEWVEYVEAKSGAKVDARRTDKQYQLRLFE